MPFAVLVLGWGAVTAWFLAWDRAARRLRGRGEETAFEGSAGPAWRVYIVESALLTLFAGLWFASLGHGGWVLVFTLLGAITEWAARTRGAHPPGRGGAVGFVAGVARTVVAGGLLRWIL